MHLAVVGTSVKGVLCWQQSRFLPALDMSSPSPPPGAENRADGPEDAFGRYGSTTASARRRSAIENGLCRLWAMLRPWLVPSALATSV
jgi:hypothetical protein